jgi:hypothetical protein
MSLIYLASPYTHPDKAVRETRYYEACRCAAWLMLNGYGQVFSPISHSHGIYQADTRTGQSYEHWVELDELMIGVADCLMVLRINGWEESKGVNREVEVARRLGKPVGHIEPVGKSYSVTGVNIVLRIKYEDNNN